MSYVDDLAVQIRRRIPSQLLPEGETAPLFRLYAVLALAKGDQVALEDVHDAWAAWMSEQNPDHKSLRPLEELSSDIRCADQPYLEAIQAVARESGIGR